MPDSDELWETMSNSELALNLSERVKDAQIRHSDMQQWISQSAGLLQGDGVGFN